MLSGARTKKEVGVDISMLGLREKGSYWNSSMANHITSFPCNVRLPPHRKGQQQYLTDLTTVAAKEKKDLEK